MSGILFTPEELALREYQAGDEDFMLQVYASTRADEMTLVDWLPEQVNAFIQMQYAAQRKYYLEQYKSAEYYIIKYNGNDAGRLIIDRSDEMIHLMDIALLPEYREKGLGSKLIKDLLLDATREGKPIRLYVEIFNRALHLYERFGFKKLQQVGVYYEMEWKAGVG